MGMLNKRKRRNDRNQVVYMIQQIDTGQFYIGLTAVNFKGNVQRTLARRLQKHVQRAYTENKNWGLSKAIRKFGAHTFVCLDIDVVRGKKFAHQLETNLINNLQPELNTFGIK